MSPVGLTPTPVNWSTDMEYGREKMPLASPTTAMV